MADDTRMIKITALGKEYEVYTRKVGSSDSVKVLLLHGGPGSNHRIYEIFDQYMPNQGVEYYYYDQLGSYHSDKPDNSDLWEIERFVDEVEQVRIALGLNSDNFYVFGSSWGGLLGLEYAYKYQKNLKGLICSAMQANCQDYSEYIGTLRKQVLTDAEENELLTLDRNGDYDNPRFNTLLEPYYLQFVLRMPFDQWPEPVLFTLGNMNKQVYRKMNGASEMTLTGTLKDWDIKNRLSSIEIPTLIIGSEYNTMDPVQMRWMAEEVKKGRYHHCSNGSHLAMWDDSDSFFESILKFIEDVEKGDF